MATIIGPGNGAATPYFNQRKIDHCQNGVQWAVFNNGDTGVGEEWRFHYSTDDGATWTYATGFGSVAGSRSYIPNGSFFIDLDDYAHFVYKNHGDGYVYYRRGTPNAARTAWTWSAATQLTTNANFNYPDIVAHRQGTGWTVHIVTSFPDDLATAVRYIPITITSGGTITAGTPVDLASPYGNYAHKWPSIDFHHTGDGKTVGGGTPHLYVAWSAGAMGAGTGVRFKKASYSAGVWTWGAEREIDSTRRVHGDTYALNCLFDGVGVIIGGFLYDGSGYSLVLYERDADDTVSPPIRVLLSYPAYPERLLHMSMSYDIDRNVYYVGASDGATWAEVKLHYRKWNRSADALEAYKLIADINTNPFVSCGRGYYDQYHIDLIHSEWTSSGWLAIYDRVITVPPPDIVMVTEEETFFGVDQPTLEVSVTDPDADQISVDFEVFTSGDTSGVPLWTGSTAPVTGPLSNASLSVQVAAQPRGVYYWRARAYDGISYSDWTALRRYVVYPQTTLSRWDGAEWLPVIVG